MFLLRLLTILCILTAFLRVILGHNECPAKCSCKRTNQADTAEWVKVRCGDFKRIQTLEELDFNNIASEIVHLNLSNNSMSNFQPKIQFVALQKLDISGNQLVDLVDRQFIEVPNLKRLDISGNQIKNVGRFTFENLRLLERLKLNNNFINTIEKGTFDYLENLKQLDISNNPLTCDCKLLWLLKWAENTSVKLMSNPKCASPAANKGISIKKLKIGEHIHCKSPAQGNREIPIVEITPNYSQIVFEGDSLRLNCKAPSSLESYDIHLSNLKDNIEWLWLDLNPRTIFDDVLIENKYLEDVGLIDSSLIITKLNRNHSGMWNCELISNKHRSKSVKIIVISNETKFCSSILTSDNKGSYIWPKTIVNNTVFLPCKQTHLSLDINLQKVTYFCGENGKWSDLNTTMCSYISDTTRILEQFSKFSLAMGKGGIIESAKHFKNYISDLNQLKDVEDLIFIIRTIESYAQFVPEENELGQILVEIASMVMFLNETFISETCSRDNSCNKLIKSIENIAQFTTTSSLHKSNIALEIFPVKQTTFSGMTCTWYITHNNLRERLFYCATTNQITKSVTHEKIVEASIQVPILFFHQLRNREILQETLSHKILISMFGDAKFFPIKNQNEIIVSAVVGIKLDDENQIENLTDPISIMLRTPKSSHTSSELIPVWWNKNLNNGTGSWTSNGCYFIEEILDCTVFKCYNLGYYALKQNSTQTSIKYYAKFKFSHSAIYIGSFILFMCLLTSILTYLFFYAAIQMPRKAKHSLLNIWISIAFLCFIYVFGIYQTEDLKLCQIIGLILHYLTLSSLLWMCVGVNGMYKRLRKNDNRVLELQDDEIGEEHIKKPIIGLYFVGWGIALIVCGISSAVNMKEYSSVNYCFLSSEPALSALYVPFTILIITLCIYFSLIRCAMYSIVDTGGHLSEGTQATENVDLDLLEPNFPNNSIPSISTKSSSETEDPEHAPIVQLKAYIIFLFIYVLTWILCAFSTIQPIKLKRFEEVFCVAYAILAIVLGSFTVFFYCIARNDVRTRYVLFTKDLKKKRLFCFFIRSRNISDTTTTTTRNVSQIQIQPLPPIPIIEEGGNSNQTRSSSRSSSNNTKSNNSHQILKGADLNAYSDSQGIKINNVNLVVLHRKQYRGNSVVPNLIENPTNSEMFYNPHQITVARKFFRKQKRNMMKHTNLVTKRNEFHDNSSIASFPKTNNDNQSVDHQSIFSTNSKVNNTNIHIEKIRKQRNTNNPNILLIDSYDEEATKPTDFKDKKRKHKKKQINNYKPTHDNMRSVSQQCTLEYSSEAISDSILDQRSPEKIQNNFNPEIATTTTEKTIKISENVDKLNTVYEPSLEENSFLPGRIYVNPSHEPLFPINKRVQSRASSVSASEIDELYQEIRGPRHNKYDRMRQPSPCYSDSEVTSGVSEVRFRSRRGFFGEKFSTSNV
nr:adhesion G protein-coupled receptor A3-like [Onthophagus taurus]